LLGRQGGVSIYVVESLEELQSLLVQNPLFNFNDYEAFPLLEYESVEKLTENVDVSGWIFLSVDRPPLVFSLYSRNIHRRICGTCNSLEDRSLLGAKRKNCLEPKATSPPQLRAQVLFITLLKIISGWRCEHG